MSDAAVGIGSGVGDRRRQVHIRRRGAADHIAVGIGGKADGCGQSGGTAAGRIGGLALDRGSIRQCDIGRIGFEVDRGYVEARQRLGGLRAVRIGRHHVEIAEIGVAGVERAVVIGIEDVEQRLHVRGGARVPVREDDLVRLRQLTAVGRIEEQHPIAGARPGGQVLLPAARHIEELVRRRQLRDVDAVAVQVEHHRRAGGRRI